MKRHYYGEPESSRLGDFIGWMIGGTVGFFSFLGWLLASFGWLSPGMTMLLCCCFGLAFGAYMARTSEVGPEC
jgi:hypothetical protein